MAAEFTKGYQSRTIKPDERRHQMLEALNGCRKLKTKYKPQRKMSSIKNTDSFRREHDGYAWRSCAKKMKFKSQGEATEYMHRSRKNHGEFAGRVYYCDICRHWHITVKHSR